MKVLSVIVGAAFAAVMSSFAESVVMTGDGVRAEFDSRNGALISIAGADGVNRVLAAPEAFAVSMLNTDGDETVLQSRDFVFRRSGDVFAFSRGDGFEVILTHRISDGALATQVAVSGIPDGMRMNWIDAPRVDVPENAFLYWPMYDGCEVSDFTYYDGKNSWCVDEPVGFFKRCRADPPLYPGNVTMQFMASYHDGKGLYFAAEDTRHIQKGVRWSRVESGRVRLSMQVFCGDGQEGRRWNGNFRFVLRPYDGGWCEACGFYRDWVRRLPGFEVPTKRPRWLRDSPVVIAYPIRGEGKDNEPLDMGPNAYYPYVNALPEIRRYHEYFGTGILALLMHWEGTAPWAPPYVWPPYGGEGPLAEFRDALHANGDKLGLYCSGTAWTQVSMIVPSYSRTREYTVGRLDRWMMRGPKGEIDAQVCNHPRAQRIGYDLCLTEMWSRDTVKREIASMDAFGVDYCQFFDQNLGGGAHLCFSDSHRHPPVPGAWGTEAMRTLQRESLGRMLLGCEGGAATPFVPNLFFNDSRSFFPAAFGLGRPVPGLSYVFHEWSSNFSGNGIGMKAEPIFRLAYSFHNGDMLTLVLAGPGRLAHAWGVRWNDPMDEELQGRVLSLVKAFNDLRKTYPQYLFSGRMIPPFVEFETEDVEVRLGGGTFRYPDVLSSFYEAEDGSRIGFVTNWRDVRRELVLKRDDGSAETVSLSPSETRVVCPSVCRSAQGRPWLIINEDNDHYFKNPSELMTVEHLEEYIDYVCRGPVTHFFMCPSGQRASFDSKTWEPIWMGANEPDHFGKTNNIWCVNAKLLKDRGIDPYAVWTKRCRERGVSPWISMRMNDAHFSNITNYFRNTTFTKRHKDLTVNPEGGKWSDGALDYARSEVRAYSLVHVRELAERYDVDGMELDWMRCGRNLRPGREGEDGHFITEFMRDVRQVLDDIGESRGRHLGLGVRVCYDPDLARERMGMDVESWVREGLVDVVVPHGFYFADVGIPVRKWLDRMPAARKSVRIIPGLDYCHQQDGKHVWMNMEKYRWAASRYYDQGAQGIYLFNLPYLGKYQTDGKVVPTDVAAEVFAEGLAPESVRAGKQCPIQLYHDYPDFALSL